MNKSFSSDIFNKNVECYTQKNSSLKEYFKEFLDKGNTTDKNFEIVTGKKKYLTLKYTEKYTEEEKVTTQYIYSVFEPLQETEKKVDQLHIQENNIIFLFGMGLCYHIEPLKKRIAKNSRIFVFEPFPELCRIAFEKIDLTNYINDEMILFFFGEDVQRFSLELIKSLLPILLKTPLVITLPYLKGEETYIKKILGLCSEGIESQKLSLATQEHFFKTLVKNSLENFKYFCESISIANLKNLFLSAPAIIIGPGPSLSKNFSYLHLIKDKCIFIVTDAAVKYLTKNNIAHHIIVSTDPQELNFSKKLADVEINNNLSDFSNYQPLCIAPDRITPLVSKKFKHNLLLFLTDTGQFYNLIQSYLPHPLPTIDIGLSVTHFALEIAVFLGCSPVALLGFDFAIDRDFCRYAFSESQVKDKSELLTTLSIWNNEINTQYDLIEYKNFFEKLVYKYKSNKIFDIREYGAEITGLEKIPFKEFIYRYLNKSVTTVGTGHCAYSTISILFEEKLKNTNLDILNKQDACSTLNFDTNDKKINFEKVLIDLNTSAKNYQKLFNKISGIYEEIKYNYKKISFAQNQEAIKKFSEIFNSILKEKILILALSPQYQFNLSKIFANQKQVINDYEIFFETCSQHIELLEKIEKNIKEIVSITKKLLEEFRVKSCK